jgi:hypothetical protein
VVNPPPPYPTAATSVRLSTWFNSLIAIFQRKICDAPHYAAESFIFFFNCLRMRGLVSVVFGGGPRYSIVTPNVPVWWIFGKIDATYLEQFCRSVWLTKYHSFLMSIRSEWVENLALRTKPTLRSRRLHVRFWDVENRHTCDSIGGSEEKRLVAKWSKFLFSAIVPQSCTFPILLDVVRGKTPSTAWTINVEFLGSWLA